MVWFKKRLCTDVKSICSDLAAAYAERAQLGFQFLVMEPKPSLNEFVAFWALTAGRVSKDEPNLTLTGITSVDTYTRDLASTLTNVTRTFFDSTCRGLMKNCFQSDLELSLESPEIRAIAEAVLGNIRTEIAEPLGTFFVDAATNALKLANGTMSILMKKLSREDADEARRYAVGLVRRRPDLSAIVKAETEERLSQIEWAKPE